MKNTSRSIHQSTPVSRFPLPPALTPAAQRQAFAEFAEAAHSLRSHLHTCGEAARHILALARACASGATGTKNDAKKYFEAGSLSADKVRDCETAPDADSFSAALHALGGKPALYEECLKIAADAGAGFCTPTLKRLEAGYVSRRNHIVQGNLRLAASVANKHPRGAMDEEDVLQHAAIALQKAVESFKASKGNQFSTFATTVIQNELKRVRENSSHQVRVPCHMWTRLRRLNEAREKLAGVLGRKPSLEQLARELDVPVGEVVQLEQAHWEPVSLSTPVGAGDSEDDRTLGDTLPDEGAQSRAWEPGLYAERIEPYSARLDFTEQSVLRRFAGYGFHRPMDVEEIAAEHGMTPAEVSRTLLCGMEKVRVEAESARRAA
jgi:RNA polymerase sigma factor (sigma-70 family)